MSTTDTVLLDRIAQAYQHADHTCAALQALHRAASDRNPLLEPYLRQLIGEAVHLQTRLHELKDLSLTRVD